MGSWRITSGHSPATTIARKSTPHTCSRFSYTFKTTTTLSFATESTYDWIGDQWTVPLVAGVSQLVKIGKLPMSLGVNGKYWVEGPDSAPDWGMRFTMTSLFPK